MGHVKIIQSGNSIEIYEYEKEINKRLHEPRPRKSTRGNIKFPKYRRTDNVRRLVKSFIRLVRANLVGPVCPALFTLTMFEVCPIHTAYNDLTFFISRLREFHGKDFRYIGVPEFQKRGAVHFHLIIWGLPDQLVLNERNNRYFQSCWQKGYVDCIPTDGHPKIAGYIGKYMSKAMFDNRLFGKKAYCTSRNVLRSVSLSFKAAHSLIPEIWEIDTKKDMPKADHEFDTQWLGKARYRRYEI